LAHPIDAEADAFYRRFGFDPTPPTRAATDYVAQGRPAISADMKR